jgi:hypothetical protein
VAVDAVESVKPAEKKVRAVRAKKADNAVAAESPLNVVDGEAKTAQSPTVAPPVASAPASAIDAFAAFLAKDGLNPVDQNAAAAAESEPAKLAKKPRASKTASRGKKS